MTKSVVMFSKAEQKFINYHKKLVKDEEDRVKNEKKKMADKCHDRFVKKFGDGLFQVGFSPDQVSSKIRGFESAIITIQDIWILAKSNGNVGRDISFFILKKCRNCPQRYEEYIIKEKIRRIDDIGKLLMDDSDDHLCWDCHKLQQEGKIK